MFSSIISLFKNITKAKYKKEKKETKKKVKQEEIKILKQLKNKLAGVAHIKAKEAESVKDSEKKAKKLKMQVFLLNLLQTFIEFLEFTFGSIITIVILLLFCIALVFIIVWVALNGLLHIDMSLGNGDIFTGKKDEECIQGSQVISDIEFDDSILGSLGGTLTDQQKQIYRSAKVYTEIYNGVFGDPTEMFDSDYAALVKKLDVPTKVAVTMGFMSIENGFDFPGSSNIFTEPMTTKPDTHNDAWLGMEAEKKDFDGKYEGKQYYSQSFVDKFKQSYSYPNWSSLISCYNFGPYGIATQIGTLSGFFNSSPHDEVVSLVAKYAAEFGISANLDKLTALCQYFMTANAYHGRNKDMTEPNIIFWVALWASTSENDAERGFDKIVLNNKSYAESTYRGEVLGYSSYKGTYNGDPCTITNLTYEPNDTTNGYFKINGQEVKKPLIKFVSDYCESKGKTAIFSPVIADLNGRAYASTLGRAVLNQNYAYGLIAYLAGLKVLNDIGVSMPVATGGSIDDCECYEGTTSITSNSNQSVIFNNFLFIGDSHTVQLNNNIDLESKGHFVMAAVGASQSQFIGTSTGKKQIGMTGTYKDVSLSDYDKSKIKGVIVSLGSNARTSTGKMKEFLDEIVAYFDVPIFVQRVFPLGPGYSNYQSATQDVEKFNAEIKSYCDSNSELTYIDATNGLIGSDGNLINGADDGLHLTYGSDAVKVRQMWYDNIKSAVEGSSNSGSDYLSTQIECIANETMGENHTIDYENGANTLKNFLAIAMKPVGECMYSWGGGRDEYIYAKGVSPRWKEFYLEQLPKGSYNFKAHCPYPKTSKSSNADGLDCSGFVGWCIVNNRETVGSQVYYTVGAASEGNYLSGKGFGQIVSAGSAEFSYLPGDVYYNSGHTWICIGPSKHGGCVFVHASPDGVQINGFGGGEKTAYEYMAKYWPDFLVFAKNSCKADSSYQTSYDQFTWYILSEQDTSGKGLKDPDGFRSKTAEEILDYLFNPPTSSYSSVGTGDFINTKGQPQGIWETKEGQKTTMDLINSMQVGKDWGGVSAGNMTQAFITRVKNFVPYMGDAVHAKDGNPTCANTEMAKRILTETKFKVPYYHQGSTSEESWARLKSGTSYNSDSNSSFYIDGCHIYSFAYALSATQQRLINPPEALVIGWYGGLWSGGMGGDSNIKALKDNLNLNVKTMQDGKFLGKADVDSVLDKNGVVIVYLTKPFSSGDFHWVVITERVKDNGVDKYKIWTSTKISQVFQLYTFDELYNKRVGSNWIRMGVMP